MEERLVIGNLIVDQGGREVLHGINLELEPGLVTALLGANGAGKSSLVSAVAGNVAIRSGVVKLDGRDIHGLQPHAIRRMGVAVVNEGHPVLSNLSVRDNLRAAGMMFTAAETERHVTAVLEIFPELEAKLDLLAGNLSGGQKQMVNIAQALIAQPRYLLIDELSLGLAPAIVKRLGGVIKQIASGGVGVLLIEQFTSLALSIAPRAYVMERGRIVYAGPSEQLRVRPEILHGAYLG